MTMHLEGPWLSTTGRRKGKQKWASAEQKQRAEELNADWERLKAKYAPNTQISATSRKTYTPPRSIRRDEGPRIPSLDTGYTGAVTTRAPMQYTGTKIKGIGTMHKSNAVPIFTDDEAKDIAHMRR